MRLSEIKRVRLGKLWHDIKLAVVILMIVNFVATLFVIKVAGAEVIWAAMNKDLVDREIVRVQKAALDGRILSPVPLDETR